MRKIPVDNTVFYRFWILMIKIWSHKVDPSRNLSLARLVNISKDNLFVQDTQIYQTIDNHESAFENGIFANKILDEWHCRLAKANKNQEGLATNNKPVDFSVKQT